MIFSDEDSARRLADELAIRNLLALVARYADDGPLEAYGALFTPDARWELPGARVRVGRADIVAGGFERRAAGEAGPGTHTRHLVSTVSVTVDGDLAQAESYWQFYADTATSPALRLMGHYRDTFRRTDDGWRLHERRVTVG